MFDLDTYLQTRRTRIEDAIESALPELMTGPEVLSAAIRHAVQTGGKRLRPIVCLAAAEAAGGSADAAMPAALAVEFLHTYTLIHDDLPCMDNDTERRGHPTVHVAFGEDLAVLAGDALQTMAFEMLSTVRETRPGMIAHLVRVLAQAAGSGGVVGGQVEDIRISEHPDLETIAYIHQHKTADLFEASTRLGAISSGAAQPPIDALGAYGAGLGLAFQILDDILDDPSALPPEQREANCLSVLSVAAARSLAHEHTLRALESLEGLPGPTEPLRTLATALLKRR